MKFQLQHPLLYGTKNPAKLALTRRYLQKLNVGVIGLSDLGEEMKKLPQVEETGATPLENAKLKAFAYYEALKRPVFSVDSGLYFEEVPDDLQPGVHVRRHLNADGNYYEMTDEEMTLYYSRLATEYGVPLPDSNDPSLRVLHAYYYNGICFVYDTEHVFERMSRDLSGEDFLLCNKPHAHSQPGFPLDRLSLHPVTGKYYYDLDERGDDAADDLAKGNGVTQFFSDALRTLQ